MAMLLPGEKHGGTVYQACDGERPMSNRYTTHAEAAGALRRHLAEYAREGIPPTGCERVRAFRPEG